MRYVTHITCRDDKTRVLHQQPNQPNSAQRNSIRAYPTQGNAARNRVPIQLASQSIAFQFNCIYSTARPTSQPPSYCRSPCDRPTVRPPVRTFMKDCYLLSFSPKIAQFYTTHTFVYVSEWDIRCPNVLHPLHQRIYSGNTVLTVRTGEGVSCTPTANIFERLYVAYYRCHFDTAGNVEWSFCAFSFPFTSCVGLNVYISLTTYSFLCGNHNSWWCPSSW